MMTENKNISYRIRYVFWWLYWGFVFRFFGFRLVRRVESSLLVRLLWERLGVRLFSVSGGLFVFTWWFVLRVLWCVVRAL
jgi:hypothetical protein